MSHGSRHMLLVEGIERGFLGLPRGNQQGRCRHHNGQLRDQLSTALDATINPNAAAAGRLRLSNRGVEKFWDAHAVQHFRHYIFPALVVGASLARGNSGSDISFVASGFASHPTNWGYAKVPVSKLDTFATGERA